MLCISLQGGQFDARDFLLYYYYGGMIYTALKNYNRALYCFEVVSRLGPPFWLVTVHVKETPHSSNGSLMHHWCPMTSDSTIGGT